ncbi:unnamed protein product [Pedinophyceae sp. YPF-701]|nr:unnamed protein product [Pedinophyceae sp. YPF-701]
MFAAPLDSGDAIFAEKKAHLVRLGLDHAPLSPRDCLRRARVVCLHSSDLYRLPLDADFAAPVSTRNEAAALSLLVQRAAAAQDRAALEALAPYTDAFAGISAGPNNAHESGASYPPDSPNAALMAWARGSGVEAAVEPGAFSVGGCGAMASRDLAAGDVAVSLPPDLIVGPRLVERSPVGQLLAAIQAKCGFDDETRVLLFILLDSHNDDMYGDSGNTSPLRAFWTSLPRDMRTAAAFSAPALAALRDTPALADAQRVRERLRVQYDALFPWLTETIPQAFPPEIASWDRWLWAAQLWMSYAFEIEHPDGVREPALLPVVQLFNHSPWPHATRYGKADPATGRVIVPLFRPARKGEQVFLSYGPRPARSTLVGYGFVARGFNPHDCFAVALTPPDDAEDRDAARRRALLETLGLGLDHVLPAEGCALPWRLLACARVLVARRPELAAIEDARCDPRRESAGHVAEGLAGQAVRSVLTQLALPFQGAEFPSEEEERAMPWDEVACKRYCAAQRELLDRALFELKAHERGQNEVGAMAGP